MLPSKVVYLLMLLSFAWVSCSKSTNSIDQTPDKNKQLLPTGEPVSLGSEGQGPIINQQNNFSIERLKGLANDPKQHKNILVSPLSIYLDLSMAYNGAQGKTASGMEKVLKIDSGQKEALNETNRSLIKNLPSLDAEITIDIANSIWFNQSGPQPYDDFLRALSASYDAKIKGLDFGNSTSVDQINNWVSKSTHQKINKIIDRLTASDLMYLLNAVYFKGSWTFPFNPDNTGKRTFTTSEGKEVNTNFMSQKRSISYVNNDDYTIAELPYGKEKSFNMYLIMPKGNDQSTVALKTLLSSFNQSQFEEYLSQLHQKEVLIRLPKWEYQYEIENMKPQLIDLGMVDAFDPQTADFTAMYPPEAGAFISKVIHKTYIKVDEEGTEAAAITGIGVGTTSAPVNPPEILDFNRPFLYLITEKSTGSILFLGILENPEENGNL